MLSLKSLKSYVTRARRRFERTVFRFGDRVECVYCGWTGWQFLSAGNPVVPNRLCPGCGSLERYRMLPLLLRREWRGDRARVLEMAPRPCFTRYVQNLPGWRYVSCDLSSSMAMVRGDLRQMPFERDAFDVIVVFHVMEHIQEDAPAFREIARMLSPGGIGIICVPLEGDVTQEGAPQEQWEVLYGQYDHVRRYGADIQTRMRDAGLAVTCIDTLHYFAAEELERHALRGEDRYLFVVRKEASA